MITDVLYSVNMYIRFCVKSFELSHVMDIALQKCYVLLLLLLLFSVGEAAAAAVLLNVLGCRLTY